MIQILDITGKVLISDPQAQDVAAAISSWVTSQRDRDIQPGLCGADLPGVDLSGADLSCVCFCGSNLQGANFLGANLSGADFRGANLRNACFAGANLTGANLTGADLAGVDVRGANLCNASVYDSDFIDIIRNNKTANGGLAGANIQNINLV